jgi:hypothetical protein
VGLFDCVPSAGLKDEREGKPSAVGRATVTAAGVWLGGRAVDVSGSAAVKRPPNIRGATLCAVWIALSR